MLLRTMSRKISKSTLNPRVLEAQYAVRGPIVAAAGEYSRKLAEGQGADLPFKEVISCNIGNPQATGCNQSPLTFPRQVLASVMDPSLLDLDPCPYPRDVRERARNILSGLNGGSVGAYSDSTGSRFVKEDIARFIGERDGFPADPDSIIVSNGASDSIAKVMSLITRGPEDGTLVPIPQYPLYSATITLLGGSLVPFYLDEDNGWSMSLDELNRAYTAAESNNVTPRAMVIINPGNPTGQVLSRGDIETVLRFCEDKDMLLLSDEVYQSNIYADRPFVSARKVALETGAKCAVASFHSTSKGFLGECGLRGGYAELLNWDPEVKAELYKLCSMHLCSNLTGQVMVSLMVNPPREGDESYDKYAQERDAVLASLKRRAQTLCDAFNAMEGVTCNPAPGSMYLFPRIRLPQKAIDAAEAKGTAADAMYCRDLLDHTGVCVVPGSGFHQVEGTYHFRCAFLPPEDQIEAFAAKVGKFHEAFMAKYK